MGGGEERERVTGVVAVEGVDLPDEEQTPGHYEECMRQVLEHVERRDDLDGEDHTAHLVRVRVRAEG